MGIASTAYVWLLGGRAMRGIAEANQYGPAPGVPVRPDTNLTSGVSELPQPPRSRLSYE
jgi:hypothetical protein